MQGMNHAARGHEYDAKERQRRRTSCGNTAADAEGYRTSIDRPNLPSVPSATKRGLLIRGRRRCIRRRRQVLLWTLHLAGPGTRLERQATNNEHAGQPNPKSRRSQGTKHAPPVQSTCHRRFAAKSRIQAPPPYDKPIAQKHSLSRVRAAAVAILKACPQK